MNASGNVVRWRLHSKTPRARLFDLWATDRGRERFWAERSVQTPAGFVLSFPDGSEETCRVIRAERPGIFEFEYFGSTVLVELAEDGSGGTDVTLTNNGVAATDLDDVRAGWLNVLLPLKAAADFGIDLRNHDPMRTWRQGYVDQ